jgi:putative MATE family efflux protein
VSELSLEEQAIADEAMAEADQGPMREAIQGDLTQGPILKTLVAFSVPMLIGNMVQTLNGSINAIWIGRLLGENALAATTNANGVMFLVFALVFGFGTATTVRVGQHFGARNIDEARRTFGSGLGFCVGLSIVLVSIGWFASPRLLELMSTPAGSVDLANTYLRVIFLSIPFGTANMMLGMSLRGSGDSKSPLYAMILTVGLDIVLNPLLIRGLGPIPGLGIAGSAIASFIAGLGGVSLLIFNLYRKDLALRLRGKEFGYILPRREELRYIFAKGLPMGGQMLLISTAQLAMMYLVNLEGVDSTAAYGVSMQLWNYLQMPAMAISAGVSAMVAQNIGAGHHERVKQVTSAGLVSNVLMTGVLAVLLVSFSHPLLALFLGSASPALPIAQHIQYIVTWSFLVMGASMVVGGTMRAYGVVVWPLIIQLVAYYPVRLGFYYFAYPSFGPDALWWAFPVSSLFAIICTTVLYTRGNWRHKRHLAYIA